MKARELIKILEEHPDACIEISVDISSCDNDSDRRVFLHDFYGVNDLEQDVLMLLFGGSLNYEESQEDAKRLDWLIENNAQIIKCGALVGVEFQIEGNASLTFSGFKTAREAIDAAMRTEFTTVEIQ